MCLQISPFKYVTGGVCKAGGHPQKPFSIISYTYIIHVTCMKCCMLMTQIASCILLTWGWATHYKLSHTMKCSTTNLRGLSRMRLEALTNYPVLNQMGAFVNNLSLIWDGALTNNPQSHLRTRDILSSSHLHLKTLGPLCTQLSDLKWGGIFKCTQIRLRYPWTLPVSNQSGDICEPAPVSI